MAQQDINISKWGTKLLCDSISRNKVPSEYLSISKNARIKDWTITKRPGQRTKATYDAINGEIQMITYNNGLLVVMGGSLYSINTSTRDETLIGSIGTTGLVNCINYGKYTIILTGVSKPYIYDGISLFILGPNTYLPAYLTSGANPTTIINTWKVVINGTFNITIDGTLRSITGLDFSTVTSMSDVATIIQTKIRTITSGKETVEFTSTNKFIIRSGNYTTTSAITVTSAQGTGTDISGAGVTSFLDMESGVGVVTAKQLINNCPDVNPIIGDVFGGFTFIVGNTEASKNILYISRPIIGTEQWRAFDWTGSNAENITFDNAILGVKSTMAKIFIFRESVVEYIGKDSLATIGGTASLISTPIGNGGALASYNGVVSAANKVFWLTKTNTINTFNYIEGTIEPEIATLTDDTAFIITKYLQNLDEDQSNCKSWYDDNTKEAIWLLKSNNSLYNDLVLVYDLGHKTWTTDTNRLYNDVVIVNNKTYAGSSIDCTIKELNTGYDDDNTSIEFEIQDTDIMLGTIKEKMFSGWQTSGGLNKATNLEFNTLVDDNTINVNYIRGTDYYNDDTNLEDGAIGGTQIGGTGLGGLNNNKIENFVQFDKTLDHGYVYRRGKRIKRNIKENSLGSNFYLDYFTLFASVTGNIELNDKF